MNFNNITRHVQRAVEVELRPDFPIVDFVTAVLTVPAAVTPVRAVILERAVAPALPAPSECSDRVVGAVPQDERTEASTERLEPRPLDEACGGVRSTASQVQGKPYICAMTGPNLIRNFAFQSCDGCVVRLRLPLRYSPV